ncbi:RuvX/YqgF family protein [Synergistaceae bacterium OttesenSCG-928-I11]|nr:RuvX/YqgF family protein [Synergistaceae bacterium OttesenSCG-928-I11]
MQEPEKTQEKTNKKFCGIDPGREKFGLAICDESTLLFSAIVPVDAANVVADAIASGDFSDVARWRAEGDAPQPSLRIDAIFLGDGTGHETFARALAERNIPFTLADETMTTLDARALYWRLHPPKFLWRLLPLSLRVPPRPIDDLAAWAIVRRARNR